MEGKCFDAGIIVAGGKYSAVLVDEVMSYDGDDKTLFSYCWNGVVSRWK
jgi:hypothetical protein